MGYNENNAACKQWSDELYSIFKENVNKVSRSHSSSNITTPNKPGPMAPQKARNMHLLESCMVFRLEDYNLYKVSTANDSKRSMPKKFLCSDKKALLLPPEMSSIHFEYTEYYFPEGHDFPGEY